jgi:hypothetical protein
LNADKLDDLQAELKEMKHKGEGSHQDKATGRQKNSLGAVSGATTRSIKALKPGEADYPSNKLQTS